MTSKAHITQTKNMPETVLLDGYSLSPEVLVSLQEGFNTNHLLDSMSKCKNFNVAHRVRTVLLTV